MSIVAHTVELPSILTFEGLGDMYRSKALTPEAVVAGLIRRAAGDADRNIWIAGPSLEIAGPYLERLGSLDPDRYPLWGIPFAIKDNIDLAGVATTAGCPDYAYTPLSHAAAVERLIEAGAIPIGKTNLDQFATGLVGTRSPYGETHNALRPELISGGSSSGSAVAVASGHCAFALGTDTAGSGRVPAALNGLVGFKPRLGAWPTEGVVPACASLDCVSVFTHALGDAALVDSVVRGYAANDPWSRELPRLTPRVPSRICLPRETPQFFGPYAAEYEAAWLAAAERLTHMGLPVERIDTQLFDQAASILYDGPWIAERWAALGPFVEAHPGSVHPVTERVLRSGASELHGAADVFRAMHKLQHLRRQTAELLADAVLVMPTTGGTWTREQLRADPVAANSALGRYTNHCNLLDLGAIAVPAGNAAEGVPFGITLFALAQDEGLAYEMGRLFVNGEEAAATIAASPPSPVESTLVAVCGLHMRGYPLEKQMLGCGATFVREARTAAKYQLLKLPTEPAKPGLIRLAEGGCAVELELWEMPLAAFGGFAASIPAPLGIGKVQLEDGAEVSGFICEGFAAADAEDVTQYGGWRYLPTPR